MIEALRNRRIAGAALDAFRESPCRQAIPIVLWAMSWRCRISGYVSRSLYETFYVDTVGWMGRPWEDARQVGTRVASAGCGLPAGSDGEQTWSIHRPRTLL
jgi:hypothetical protein